MITRRTALKNLALTLASQGLSAEPPAEVSPVFKLPPLGYDYDALEPWIDAETMKIHHDKHHAAYVSKLNQAIAKAPGFEAQSIEQILSNLGALPEAVRQEIRNQGGGHANHSLFWQTLKKSENAQPSGELAKAINTTFGSLAKFQENYTTAALKVFGSGWAWLVYKDKKLTIESLPNQDSPYSTGGIPVLGLDVWEHAYYLKYQNRRADYLKAFQNVIHWDFVSERFAQISKT